VTDLTAIPWRTWGSGVICAATSPDETSDTIIGRSGEATAARACSDHNAVLDLAWLLDAGWLAQLGQARAPDNSPAGYYASVRRMGDLVSVNFTGGTVGKAAAKAREWAEGKEAAP
jgi:hypothetical protein